MTLKEPHQLELNKIIATWWQDDLEEEVPIHDEPSNAGEGSLTSSVRTVP